MVIEYMSKHKKKIRIMNHLLLSEKTMSIEKVIKLLDLAKLQCERETEVQEEMKRIHEEDFKTLKEKLEDSKQENEILKRSIDFAREEIDFHEKNYSDLAASNKRLLEEKDEKIQELETYNETLSQNLQECRMDLIRETEKLEEAKEEVRALRVYRKVAQDQKELIEDLMKTHSQDSPTKKRSAESASGTKMNPVASHHMDRKWRNPSQKGDGIENKKYCLVKTKCKLCKDTLSRSDHGCYKGKALVETCRFLVIRTIREKRERLLEKDFCLTCLNPKEDCTSKGVNCTWLLQNPGEKCKVCPSRFILCPLHQAENNKAIEGRKSLWQKEGINITF